MEQASVYALINKLCNKIYDGESLTNRKWRPVSPKKRQSVIRKLRQKSFEVLLKKTSLGHWGPWEAGEDTIFQVIGRFLELHWVGRYADSERMQLCAKQLLDTGLYEEPGIAATLELLFRLKDSIPWQDDLQPKLFRYERRKYHDPSTGPEPYELIHPSVFEPPPWMTHFDIPSKEIKGYLPDTGGFPFWSEPGHDLPLLGCFITPVSMTGTGDGVAMYTVPSFPELKEPRGLRIPPPLRSAHHQEVDEGYATPSNDGSRNVSPCSGQRTHEQQQHHQQQQQTIPAEDDMWEAALNFKMPRLRTWEQLGHKIVDKELPFFSEAGEEAGSFMWEILTLPIDSSEPDLCLPRYISQKDIIKDIGHLLMGYPSHTCPYDEVAQMFSLAPDVRVKGLSGEALAAYCKDFLLVGSCCRRLQDFVSSSAKPLSHLGDKGLVMQALRNHVRTYLQFHWGAALLVPYAQSLLTMQGQVQGLLRKTVAMAHLCFVAPAVITPPPSGMALVAHLYEALSRETRPDVCCIIYSTLKACSQVYFRFLQRWIFEGVLNDAYEEFFVVSVVTAGGAAARTRRDWSQRFQLVAGAVPGFLRGLEKDILLCGKTVNLLKLCCPKAALCVAVESGYPDMPCCLHGRDVHRLLLACTAFEARVRDQLRAGSDEGQEAWQRRHCQMASAQEQRVLQETAARAREQHQLRAQLEQEAGRQARLQRQAQWRSELEEQAAAARDNRLEQRRLQLEEDQELRQMWQHQQEQHEERVQQEKQKLIEYYEELSEVAAKRQQRAEWRLERMRLSERREEFLQSDLQEWKALAELNMKNAEQCATRQPGMLEVIAEDVSPPKALPPATLDLASGDSTKPNAQDPANAPITPNNNNNNNNNNSNQEERDVNKNNFLVESPNLLDTTNEDIALGNIPLQPVAIGNVNDNLRTTVVKRETETEAKDDSFCMEPMIAAAERNRLKVLEEEFDIVTRKLQSTSADKAKEAATAMQEWSDARDQRHRNRWNMLHGDINVVTGNARTTGVETIKCENEMVGADTTPAMDSLCGDDKSTVNAADVPGSEVEVIVSPDEEPMSVCKSYSSNSVNVFKSASALSSKASSSYNIASMTTSSSFDLGSGKFTLSTPTSTDGSVDVFKTAESSSNVCSINNGGGGSSSSSSSQRSHLAPTVEPAAFWKSTCFSAEEMKTETNATTRVDEGKQAPLPGCKTASAQHEQIEDLDDDFTLINVALQKSVAIPLYTQLRLANEAVLKFFFDDLNLYSHLVSLRSYFLLMDGEFSRTMTCDLFHKLATVQQPSHLLNYVCLNDLLRRALGASLAGIEENAERLSFRVLDTPERFCMSSTDVLRCLNLRYQAEWPLNILLTESALSKYSDIFGFLLKVRLVSWALEDAFHKLKEMGGQILNGQLQRRKVQLWRHEMTHFIRAVQGYIMSTALQTTWVEFEKELLQARTLDDLYQSHVSYVKKVLHRCLLFKQSQYVLTMLMDVFNTVLRFHEQLQVLHSGDGRHIFHKLTRLHVKYRNDVAVLHRMLTKLVVAGYMPHLNELLEMLNVNSHYSSLEVHAIDRD